MVILNIETELVKYRHFGYTVENAIGEGTHHSVLNLFEIREVYYHHPEAPENALIQRLERVLVKKVMESDLIWPAVFMLQQTQKAVFNVSEHEGIREKFVTDEYFNLA